MKKLENAIDFYYIITGLKELIRQGAVVWKVKRERMEAVSDHIFGTQILAIALKENLKLDLDLGYVLTMLAIHEIDELKMGDLTILTKLSKEQRISMSDKFVKDVLAKLQNKKYYQDMIDDFNNGTSFEAKFAKAIDKFENVLEFKKYVDSGQVDLSHCEPSMLKDEKRYNDLVKNGITRLDDIWFLYNESIYKDFKISWDVWKNKIQPLNSNKKDFIGE